MKIKPISLADFELVVVRTTNECRPTPHCKRHGAMNKITKDGIWRCVSAHSFEMVKVGNSIGKKETDTFCRAGCEEITL